MLSLQVVRPVVGRQVVVELPEDWGDVQAVDVTPDSPSGGAIRGGAIRGRLCVFTL
jgi:hypothetical protein